MSVTDKLLPEFDREFANTRKFLALVPDDRLTWKPHAKSMELGRLAWHVSDFPEFAFNVVAKPGLSFSVEDSKKRSTAWVGKTRAAIVERFDQNLKAAREAVLGASDDTWDNRWQLSFAGQLVVDDSRSAAYRLVVMNHMIHHRAQLGLYLRLNDIAIPGVYGPSADER